jgi:hypothetical protein
MDDYKLIVKTFDNTIYKRGAMDNIEISNGYSSIKARAA